MLCEYCGEEHDSSYGSGRFCNQLCSRRYSSNLNKDKKNKRLIEVFKIKKSKIVYKCVKCGIEYKKKHREKICSDCIKCGSYSKLYNKLGIINCNPIESNYKALCILKNEYFNNGKSKNMILNQYGINGNTLYRFFKSNGVQMRSLSESQYIAFDEGRRDLNNSKSNKYMCGYHTTWNNKEIYYRSSYELEFAQELDLKKIEYECEKFKIKYFDTLLNRKRIAIPDFYLPETNTIVEIKSSYTYEHVNMCNKVEAYLDLGYNFVLILDKKKYIEIIQ